MTRRGRVLALLALGAGAALGVAQGGADRPRAGPDSDRVRVEIAADGALRVRPSPGRWIALGRLSSDDVPGSEAALEALRAVLLQRSAAPAARAADGTWAEPLEVSVAPDVPWARVLWIAMTSADPRIKTGRILFPTFLRPESLAWDLPRDGSRWVDEESHISFVRVRFFGPGREPTSRPPGTLRVEIGTRREPVPEVEGDGESVDEAADLPDVGGLTRWLQSRRAIVVGRLGELETPPPGGWLTTSADVLAAWAALRDAGASDVQVVGSSPPLPRKR